MDGEKLTSRSGPKSGGPQVRSRGGNLMIRFSLAGRRHNLSLGWPDNDIHRPLALLKAEEIRRDIALGQFDESLAKYRPAGMVAGTRPDRSTPAWPSLLEVFDRYTDYKRPQCSPSTMRSQYYKWRILLTQCPVPLDRGGEIRSWLIKSTTPGYARRILQGLNGMGKWAKEEEIIPSNPFHGLSIAVPKNEAQDDPIEFWTRDERDRIIEAFRGSRYYSHYARLVEFLFFTGCRPSEAIGLQWGDVDRDCRSLTFRGAITEDEEGQLRRKDGLKRQKKRSIRLSPRLTKLLSEADRGGAEDLAFPSPHGGPIRWNNFNNRAWRSILLGLGLDNLSPYSTRHTMISLALKGCPECDPPIAPMAVEDVAAIVGNSARVIYQCYAGVSKDLELRE